MLVSLAVVLPALLKKEALPVVRVLQLARQGPDARLRGTTSTRAPVSMVSRSSDHLHTTLYRNSWTALDFGPDIRSPPGKLTMHLRYGDRIR